MAAVLKEALALSATGALGCFGDGGNGGDEDESLAEEFHVAGGRDGDGWIVWMLLMLCEEMDDRE